MIVCTSANHPHPTNQRKHNRSHPPTFFMNLIAPLRSGRIDEMISVEIEYLSFIQSEMGGKNLIPRGMMSEPQ